MNIRENIKKATSLEYIDNNAKFFRLPGLSQAAKDRMMNDRKVKSPKNIHLLEDFDKDNDVADNFMNNKVKPNFDKHEISAAIKEVNGGRDLSNKHFEKLYERQLEIINSEKAISQETSDDNNVTACTGNQSKDLDDIYTKQKHKLSKNAAIMSLLKKNQISLEEIFKPSNKTSTRKEDKLEASHEMAHGYIMDNGEYNDGQVESIALYEDPEIFVHPLQMGIDEKKCKDTDFTISRIGKKTKQTPQEYFLRATNDKFFDFVKKEKNTT